MGFKDVVFKKRKAFKNVLLWGLGRWLRDKVFAISCADWSSDLKNSQKRQAWQPSCNPSALETEAADKQQGRLASSIADSVSSGFSETASVSKVQNDARRYPLVPDTYMNSALHTMTPTNTNMCIHTYTMSIVTDTD